MDKRPLLLRTFIVLFVTVLFVLAMYPLRERDYYQVFSEMLKDKKDSAAAALVKEARDLQKKLGRKILVCVGDADNDLPMLEGADYAFCPSDGTVADRFPNVCPCNDGAVADVIYEKIPEILKG